MFNILFNLGLQAQQTLMLNAKGQSLHTALDVFNAEQTSDIRPSSMLTR